MASAPAAAAHSRARLWAAAACALIGVAAHAQDFPISEPPPAPAANPPAQLEEERRVAREAELARREAERRERERLAAEAAASEAAALEEAVAMGPPALAEFVGPPALGELPVDPNGTAQGDAPFGALELLGEAIAPGTRKELRW